MACSLQKSGQLVRETNAVMIVGVLGLEPRSLSALDFESSVFTNFTIPPAFIALFWYQAESDHGEASPAFYTTFYVKCNF